MYLNAVEHYLPTEEICNDYFLTVNGLSDEWIYQRTGIKKRKKAAENENSNTMGVCAVENVIPILPFPIQAVDLIVGATYTPHDTVGTLAHVIQRKFGIGNAAAVTISAACSSLINAIEIVEGYFAMGKAAKAIVVASEHNTAYSNETDERSGHLWGDGAAVMVFSKDRICDSDIEVLAVETQALGHIGRGPEGVYLLPKTEGIVMPYGKDVFINACNYMIASLENVLKKGGYSFENLSYIIPHQANMRIITQLASMLSYPFESILTNIEELGNTGCASTAIALSQYKSKFQKGDLVGLTVFGGGYSSGAILLKV